MLSLMVWFFLKFRFNLGFWFGFWVCFVNLYCCFIYLGREQEEIGEEEIGCFFYSFIQICISLQEVFIVVAWEKELGLELGLNLNFGFDT